MTDSTPTKTANAPDLSSDSGSLVTSVQAAATVSITEPAAERVLDQMSRRDDAQGLRFGVRKNGCSGLAYIVDLATEISDDDTVFESRGIKIIVDRKSLIAVAGTQIDFGDAEDGLSRTFLFSNPNVTGACGCGESFSVS